MAKEKKALGRGLNAIFDEVEESYNRELENSDSSKEIVRDLDINSIKPNPYQPRTHFDEKALKELSGSIKKHGLLQPIIVVQKEDGYMLLAGERRLRASKLAKASTIKAIVADIESKDLRELALIENIQREDLNPVELAIAYKELINEHKVTQEELSNIIHKSRAQITNTMRLLNLSDKTKEFIVEGKISQGHAKVLVGLDKKDENTIVDTIVGQKLSVRQTEDLVKNLKSSDAQKTTKKEKTAPLENINSVKKVFDTMGIKAKVQKNSVTISFKDDKEIENFIEAVRV